MKFYEINVCQCTIFRLYTAYNKHEIINIDNQISEKSQVLSQVLELILLPTVRKYQDVFNFS